MSYDIEKVQRLLASGKVDVNEFSGKPDQRETALHVAAQGAWDNSGKSGMYDRPDIMKLLIDAGADINARGTYMGEDNWTPMMSAAFQGYEIGLQLLLAQGADKSIKHGSRTADGMAMTAGHANLAKLIKGE